MDDVILDSIVIDVSGNGLDEHVVISRAGRKLSETLEEVKHHVNSVISEHMSSDVAGKGRSFATISRGVGGWLVGFNLLYFIYF